MPAGAQLPASLHCQDQEKPATWGWTGAHDSHVAEEVGPPMTPLEGPAVTSSEKLAQYLESVPQLSQGSRASLANQGAVLRSV